MKFGENKYIISMPTVGIFMFLYLCVLLLSLLVLNKYSMLFMFLISCVPIAILLINYNISSLILLYIAFLPIIQHFSFYGIYVGEFLINPHMLFQFILLVLIINDFLYNNYKNEKYKLNKTDKSILLMFVFSILSLIYPYSLPVDHTKRWLLFYTGIFETISFYFIIVYALFKKGLSIKNIILAILISSISSLFIAILEMKEFGFSIISIFLHRMIIGFGYHNTNLFGIFSAIVFPLYFYFLTEKDYKKYKLITFISFVILTVLSILCFNRGTFLVMGLEIFLLFFIKQNRKLIYYFSFFMILLGLAFYKVLYLYIDRFISGIGASASTAYLDVSALYRIEAWIVGLKVLYLYPFGVGAGGFQYAWIKYGVDPDYYLGTPHQLFLSIGVDYGVLTLLAFIFLLILSYIYCNHLSKSNSEYSSLFKFIKISLIGFAAYGFVTDGELSHLSGFIAPNNGYTLILFVLIAIISVEYNKYKQSKV